MIGGPKEAVDHLDPIFAALAPGLGDIPRTPGREKGDPRAERGYIHAGPSGAGHFVKMVHNGIEYGLMQAYAEGFDILRNKDSKDLPEDERFALNMPDIAEVWRRGSVISSWLLDLGAAALAKDPQLKDFSGYRPGFRRGPLDRRGRDRGSGPRRRAHHGALRPLPLAAGAHLRRKDALGHALWLRRTYRGPRSHRPRTKAGKSQGHRRANTRGVAPCPTTRPDPLPTAQVVESPPRRQAKPADPCAMVIFGAGGDLTKRLVMPALYNLSRTEDAAGKIRVDRRGPGEGTAESWRDHLYDDAEKLCRQRRRGIRRRPN